MRNHFLRASGSENATSSGGSFERGFYGGAGTSLAALSSDKFTPGSWSSTTKNEANAWCLFHSTTQVSWFTMYWNSQMVQGLITAKELTDAGVPSGAKFNKFSTYIWGRLATSGSESYRTNLPLGIRWNMFHTTSSSGVGSYEPGYAVKSGESRTLLYQDSATTRFPPFNDAFDDMQDNNANDNTIESMQLSGLTIYNGNTSTTSGTGFLVEIEAGEGDDSSASPASYFEWDGTNDIVVEISSTKASYAGQLRTNLYKHRNWKQDVSKYDDSRDDTHYGSSYWIGTGTLASPQNTFTTNTSYMGNQHKMLHSSTSETDDWYDITNSDWSISNSSTTADNDCINALKLDYTT